MWEIDCKWLDKIQDSYCVYCNLYTEHFIQYRKEKDMQKI